MSMLEYTGPENPISFKLPEDTRQILDGLSTEKKAELIVKCLIIQYEENAKIEKDKDGVDFKVTIDGEPLTIDGKPVRIEVKGTEDSGIAWSKLKVSSQKSHDILVRGNALIFRVVDVASLNPRIYILEHGKHFILEPELRWTVKHVSPKDERYTLQGKPYRYERPFDPVALDDWEFLRGQD